ncbi:hypothetical protein ACHQM5_024405 [Ranunculus cassubicifolius]
MKINVKTLKGSHFPVEVKPEDTVAEVKQNIEVVQGAGVYPAKQQVLIHQGKVLKDETTLAENNVCENSFLVIMLSKSKNVSSTGGQASSNPSAVAITPPPSSVAPPVATPPSPSPSVAPEMEGTIQQILEMGCGMWTRDIVVRALRAASNNPDRAIDFLYSGIPEQPQVVVPPPATTNNGSPQPAVSLNGPNANPLNLFSQGLPNTNNVDSAAGAGAAAGTGVFDFMRNEPQYEVLRALLQQQPEMAEQLLQRLGAQFPDRLRLIEEHPDEFNRYLSEPINMSMLAEVLQAQGALDAQGGPPPMTVTLTQEENQAVQRLQAMGFGQQDVLQAYFAHDKNEELAANYLLDHMHDD